MSLKDVVPFSERAEGALRPFESLGRALEDLFDLPLVRGKTVNTPQIDIRETDSAIEVSVALSGVEKKDISLDLTENSLAISCERREEKEEKKAGGYHVKEQSYGRFYRSFTLPAAVKTGSAKAVYKDGVLKIDLQKQRTDRARQIDVE
jgi:HSP20 family protein